MRHCGILEDQGSPVTDTNGRLTGSEVQRSLPGVLLICHSSPQARRTRD